jgi:ElaB/YqjD/DUF883 family membrane-anchored ribosome-binding protein
MGDVEETKLDQIIAEQQQQETEDAIEDAIEDVKDELEDALEDVQEQLQEVIDKPADVVQQDFSTVVDTEAVAQRTAEILLECQAFNEPEDEETPDVEETHTEPPEDEPPNSSSFLYKKRV